MWRVAPEWTGETCFIVAGGPSIATVDLDEIKGRRVIAINSSWSRVPFADFLFFGDARWWDHNRDAVLTGFAGRIATSARGIGHPRVLCLRAQQPPGLAVSPDTVAIRRTSTHAAINLAVHLDAAAVVLLGVDNRSDSSGRTHHHDPHPWDLRADCFEQQREDLATLVQPLRTLGVAVLNASLDSALPFWTKQSLREIISREADAIAQGHARAG